MQSYKTTVKEFLSDYIFKLRKNRGLSQKQMAECLHITSRAYGDLERGKFCFSSTALLSLLLMLDRQEVYELIEELRQRIRIS